MKVTVKDMKSVGFCMKGVREFYKIHGLSFTELVKEGTDIKLLEDTNDLLALKVVNKVKYG